MTLKEKAQLMDQKEIRRVLTRLATEILEQAGGVDNLVLIGIRTGGMYLAKRLVKTIQRMEEKAPEFGIVDITFYRDDYATLAQPEVGATEIKGDITGKHVVLVDDVLYTGRTVRAAIDALIDFGRPKRIQLAVLVDRGLRELPIHADFLGRLIATQPEERVEVLLKETGETDRVVLYEFAKEGARP